MEEICSCGRVHKLNTEKIIVRPDALDELCGAIDSSGAEKVLVLFDKSGGEEAALIKERISKTAAFEQFDGIASTYFADKLRDFEQELVIAVGGEALISVAKYYAYGYSCQIFILPVVDFCDLTFSSFARLYDGVQFGIYKVAEPARIFVSLCKCPQCDLMGYYISSKFMAIFDNWVLSCVYGGAVCERLEKFLSSTLATYMSNKSSGQKLLEKNVWTLIRLGQAMSFFGETKPFFSADRAIVDLLCCHKKSASLLEGETIALKLVVNSYECFFKDFPKKREFNLNKHIDTAVRSFALSPSLVIERLAPSQVLGGEEAEKNLSPHFIFLKKQLGLLTRKMFALQAGLNVRAKAIKSMSLDADKVEKSFALSPIFNFRPCAMHLMLAFGYLDRLL